MAHPNVMTIEEMIKLSFRDKDTNVVNFGLIRTLLYLFARQLKVLERQVEVKLNTYNSDWVVSNLQVTEVRIHASTGYAKANAQSTKYSLVKNQSPAVRFEPPLEPQKTLTKTVLQSTEKAQKLSKDVYSQPIDDTDNIIFDICPRYSESKHFRSKSSLANSKATTSKLDDEVVKKGTSLQIDNFEPFAEDKKVKKPSMKSVGTVIYKVDTNTVKGKNRTAANAPILPKPQVIVKDVHKHTTDTDTDDIVTRKIIIIKKVRRHIKPKHPQTLPPDSPENISDKYRLSTEPYLGEDFVPIDVTLKPSEDEQNKRKSRLGGGIRFSLDDDIEDKGKQRSSMDSDQASKGARAYKDNLYGNRRGKIAKKSHPGKDIYKPDGITDTDDDQYTNQLSVEKYAYSNQDRIENRKKLIGEDKDTLEERSKSAAKKDKLKRGEKGTGKHYEDTLGKSKGAAADSNEDIMLTSSKDGDRVKFGIRIDSDQNELGTVSNDDQDILRTSRNDDQDILTFGRDIDRDKLSKDKNENKNNLGTKINEDTFSKDKDGNQYKPGSTRDSDRDTLGTSKDGDQYKLGSSRYGDPDEMRTGRDGDRDKRDKDALSRNALLAKNGKQDELSKIGEEGSKQLSLNPNADKYDIKFSIDGNEDTFGIDKDGNQYKPGRTRDSDRDTLGTNKDGDQYKLGSSRYGDPDKMSTGRDGNRDKRDKDILGGNTLLSKDGKIDELSKIGEEGSKRLSLNPNADKYDIKVSIDGNEDTFGIDKDGNQYKPGRTRDSDRDTLGTSEDGDQYKLGSGRYGDPDKMITGRDGDRDKRDKDALSRNALLAKDGKQDELSKIGEEGSKQLSLNPNADKYDNNIKFSIDGNEDTFGIDKDANQYKPGRTRDSDKDTLGTSKDSGSGRYGDPDKISTGRNGDRDKRDKDTLGKNTLRGKDGKQDELSKIREEGSKRLSLNLNADKYDVKCRKDAQYTPGEDTLHERILIVENTPSEIESGQMSKFPFVCREQFMKLEDEFHNLQKILHSSISEDGQDQRLLDALGKGTTSIDPIAALQLSANLESTENKIEALCDILSSYEQQFPGTFDEKELSELMKGVVNAKQLRSLSRKNDGSISKVEVSILIKPEGTETNQMGDVLERVIASGKKEIKSTTIVSFPITQEEGAEEEEELEQTAITNVDFSSKMPISTYIPYKSSNLSQQKSGADKSTGVTSTDMVTHKQMNSAMEKLAQSILNEFNNRKKLCTERVDALKTEFKQYEEALKAASNAKASLEDVNALIANFAKGVNRIDTNLSTTMSKYMEDILQMQYSLELHVESMMEALANVQGDPEAVADLSKLLSLFFEIRQELYDSQIQVGAEQSHLASNLETLRALVLKLTSNKYDRSDFTGSLKNLVNICDLNKLIHCDRFEATWNDIDRNIVEAFSSFDAVEEVWQERITKTGQQISGKADRLDISILFNDIKMHCNNLDSKIKQLSAHLDRGHDHSESGIRHIIRDTNCLSCGTQPMEHKEDEPEGKGKASNITTPRATGKENALGSKGLMYVRPCYPGEMMNHVTDPRAKFCRNYCGGEAKPKNLFEVQVETRQPKIKCTCGDKMDNLKKPCLNCNSKRSGRVKPLVANFPRDA